MSLKDLFAKMHQEREARTRRERHGSGELTFLDDVPLRATGCLLPDGTLTDAECLLRRADVRPDLQRVWTRRLPGTPLRRRGRLEVHVGMALRFVDEPEADIIRQFSPNDKAPTASLERDLGRSARIRRLIESDLFATLLYGALCNTEWRQKATGATWSCSWRSAGGVVAALRCEGDYLDWYCSTGEGLVDEQVLAEIEALGWELIEASPPE